VWIGVSGGVIEGCCLEEGEVGGRGRDEGAISLRGY